MSKGVFFSVILIGTACTSMARPDLNAFLNKRVASVGDLVAQVKSDREVMDRYCRHFAMSPTEVVKYLKSLHTSKLDRSDIYVVFSVPEGGALKSHLEKLKSGTAVFVSSTGRPALLVKCGNPLSKGPKNPEMSNSIAAQVVSTEVIEPQLVPIEAVAVVESESPAQPIVEPTLAAVPDAPAENTITSTGENGTSDIPIVTSTSSFNPLALLVLPAVGMTVTKHESGQPVPEPGTIAGVGLGAASLVAYRRRRSQK